MTFEFCSFNSAIAAVPLPYYDAFNYAEGNLAANGAPNWGAGGSSTTALEIAVSNSAALTAPPGFPAASGDGVRRAPSGSSRRAVLQYSAVTNTDGNTLFVSFLLNVQTNPSAAQLVAHLDDTASSDSTPQGGIFVDNGPKVGIGKGTSSPGFTMATNLGAGTHLVIARYTFQSGNDKVDLWVDPSSSDFGAVTAPPSLGSTTGTSDPTSLSYLQIITPGTSGSLMFVDELRLGTTWADVTGTNTPVSPTFSRPHITNSVATMDGLELSGTNGTPNALYRVLAATNVSLVQTSWTAIATNTFDASGNFVFTVPLHDDAEREFYSLLVPGGGTPPSINSQPQNQTAIVGQNAVFTATAAGTAPLGYQWFFNNSAPLPGATASSFTVTNAQTDDAGSYSLQVSNVAGMATSSAALLTVIVPPAITTQPQDQTISAGQDATFSVTASGSSLLRYQWYFNTNTALANATNATLTLTNVQTTNAGKYSVTVTNSGGSTNSAFATLSVNAGPTPPTITTHPQDQTVIAGSSATFTVAASGSLPLSYQWYFNTNTVLTGSTGTSLTITNAQNTNAGYYSAVVTNTYDRATSSVARLTVNSNAPLNTVIGYATIGYTPTGGAGGTTQTVMTASALSTALKSTAEMVVKVSGTIDISSISSLNMKGNKTLIGLGTNATIIGDLGVKHLTNVIVQNLHFTNPSGVGDGDGVTLQCATNVWIDHCTFTDCADGSLDVTHASDWITISFCKFNYTANSGHNFVNLIGHSDNNASEDTGTLHVTMHHNWWSTLCVERMPRTRFGRVHVFNNYANSSGNNYCVRASIQSEVLVENNYYENIDTPYEYYAPNGKIRAVGNKTVNCSNVDPFNDTVFTPSYPYTLETPDAAKANVISGAGAGTSLFP